MLLYSLLSNVLTVSHINKYSVSSSLPLSFAPCTQSMFPDFTFLAVGLQTFVYPIYDFHCWNWSPRIFQGSSQFSVLFKHKVLFTHQPCYHRCNIKSPIKSCCSFISRLQRVHVCSLFWSVSVGSHFSTFLLKVRFAQIQALDVLAFAL